MKSRSYSKIKDVIAAHPDDIRLLQDAGLVDEQTVQELRTQQVMGSLANKYYDLAKVKSEVLEEIGGYSLQDLQFEPGKYEYAYDYLGSLETACRTFGLDNIGIQETDDGYQLGDKTGSSIEELEGAEAAMTSYADQVAQDMNEKIGMPGVFYFGFNDDWGDGGYRLFFAFEDANIPDLQKLGADLDGPGPVSDDSAPPPGQENPPIEKPQLEASFDHILAALEEEGCHDIARKLHSILREN